MPDSLDSFFARRLLLAAALVALLLPAAAGGEEVEAEEEEAIRAAVARVAPSVVQIETVGGLEKVGQVLIGTGPTTGLVVDADGWILSSAFNFVQQPSSVLVTLPGGERLPARRVATDHSRMLVLLKVESEEKLKVPESAPPDEVRVGQWAVAVGRTFSAEQASVSVGIVSAVGRMFGKAVQTDAKISPNNYGGPLVDIEGRVLGLLVPMSPQGQSEVAGVEWYDGGIGFAVPLPAVREKLALLQEGQDLHRGILGVGLKKGDPYASPAEIAALPPNSPAAQAGLQKGDRIVEFDGQKVATQMQLKLRIGPRYAGDRVRLVALRDGKRIEREIELVEKVDPFVFPFLGILPERIAAEAEGVVVRYVYGESPADQAGLRIGDRITALDGEELADVAALLEALGGVAPGDEVALQLVRGDKEESVTVVAGELPEEIPTELPPAARPEGEPPETEIEPGGDELKLPEFKNVCKLHVPAGYRADDPPGVLLWLHGAGGGEKERARLRRLCDDGNLILVAPQSGNPARWEKTEAEFLRKALDEVVDRYDVDPLRIVAHGFQAGGAMAYTVALENRDLVRGVAVVDAPLPGLGRVPANDPAERLAVFATTAAKSRFAPRIERSLKSFRDARYPLTVRPLDDEPRYLTADELAELGRWIDTLDRL